MRTSSPSSHRSVDIAGPLQMTTGQWGWFDIASPLQGDHRPVDIASPLLGDHRPVGLV